MTILLAHASLLLLLSYATAARLVKNFADRLVAAAMLFWGNIVALCLLLSCFGRLAEVGWFFRGSLLLAAGTLLLAWRFTRRGSTVEPLPSRTDKPSWLLVLFAAVTLLPLLLGNLAIAATYEPNNYDSLTYHLPRVMYYLGHGALSHFETADFRQVYYPFNFNLLQLFCFVYDAPPESVNFLNVAAWLVTGVGVHRLARWTGCSFNASLVAAWLALTATEVLAQATSTILDLPAGAALVAAILFILRWRVSRRTGDALLAALAAGLAAGTKLTVVFVGPAAALLLAAIAWHHWRAKNLRGFFTGVRQWLGPGVLAGGLTVPFVFYNLRATGQAMTHRMDFTLNKPFEFGCALQTAKAYLVQIFSDPFARFSFDTDHYHAMNEWFSQHVFAHWNEAYAFSPLLTILPDLNEDHVFFGFAGPLFLVCAVVCLWRDPSLRNPASWIALLGLGWFAAYFALNKWSSYNQRYFVPPIALLAPCAAVVLDHVRGSRFGEFAKRAVFAVVMACAVWFAGSYLTENSVRPVPFAGVTRPQLIPGVPSPLAERLAAQSRINISSYGTNERIYPLQHLGRHQRVSSGAQLDPASYHLFSFWGNTRSHIFSNLAYYSSYIVVPVAGKRTAGMEFLGTMPGSNDTFDYLGWPARANDLPAAPENRNFAMVVEYSADTNDPVRLGAGRIRILGLNPRDAAHATVTAERADGTKEQLLSVAHAEWTRVAVQKPFKRLVVEAVDDATGRSLGRAEMPFGPRTSETDTPPPPLNAAAVFAIDFISRDSVRNATVSGLDVLDGPYPQWALPIFRWAKQPAVRIAVAADPRVVEIQLSFGVRLQKREHAVLDVVHNGRVVRSLRLDGPTTWRDQVVKVTAAPGENVLELRDHSGAAAPDWLAYLEQNQDVKQYVLSQGVPLEEGARQHYEIHGRKEGRKLPLSENSGSSPTPPDSLYYVYRHLRVEGLPPP